MRKQNKKQREFFVVAETDEWYSKITTFVKGATPRQALDDFVSQFPPSGNRAIFPLHSADLYESADAHHRGRKPLATLYKETSEFYQKKRRT